LSYSVRTFRAPSMSEALAAVKRELGPDAIILGTRNLPTEGVTGWARKLRVEITAAPPGTPSPAPRVRAPAPAAPSSGAGLAARAALTAAVRASAPVTAPDNGDFQPLQPAALYPADAPVASTVPSPPSSAPPLPQDLYPHYVRLVQNDGAEELAAELVRAAARRPGRDQDVALRATVREYVARLTPAGAGVDLQQGQLRRVALVGPSGSGKSTTVAKLAALFRLRQDRRVAMLSLDMHRLDAHEQLRRYADVLEVPLYTAQTIEEVKQVTKGLDNVDLLLIDTPGVGLREQARFARVATLLRAARPEETHLVLPASLAPPVLSRMAQGFAPLGPTKVVLTRLDDVVGLGVILNVVQRLNLGLSYLTNGQNVPHDIEEACSPRLVELVCGAVG